MLCSISTQKSGSSKWLDRLRSSKGFPSGDFVNLEQFLHNNSSTSLSSPPINPTVPRSEDIGSESSPNGAGWEKEPVLEASVDGGGKEMFNAFSHVLAELFNMGESSNYAALKKQSRKQLNPRFFAASNSSEFTNVSGFEDAPRKEKIASPISYDQSRVEMKKVNGQVKLLSQGKDLVVGEDEERIDASLLEFSRSEVTVIDTSCAPWKFDKLLFRKKNVWKVRDKKTKTIYLGKKKRKENAHDDNIGRMKKHKVKSREESTFPNIEGLQPRDKFEESCKKTSDTTFGQTLEMNNRDFALKIANSSVVLIKNIPTSKKSGIGFPKNSLKASHRPPRA